MQVAAAQTAQSVEWQAATRPLVLKPAQIHVWKLDRETAQHGDHGWLDADERARLAAMSNVEARADFLAARLALRTVLAGYLDTEPRHVALRRARGGKPMMEAGPEFNLSHGGSLLLLAVAVTPVGIDVEPMRSVPRCLSIARRVLGDEVAEDLASLPRPERERAFLELWTAMEARQKCQGEGVFGRRIAETSVGSRAFLPDETHLANIAWEDPGLRPTILYFTQSCS